MDERDCLPCPNHVDQKGMRVRKVVINEKRGIVDYQVMCQICRNTSPHSKSIHEAVKQWNKIIKSGGNLRKNWLGPHNCASCPNHDIQFPVKIEYDYPFYYSVCRICGKTGKGMASKYGALLAWNTMCNKKE